MFGLLSRRLKRIGIILFVKATERKVKEVQEALQLFGFTRENPPTKESLKLKYREFSRAFHPDVQKPEYQEEALEQQKKINKRLISGMTP